MNLNEVAVWLLLPCALSACKPETVDAPPPAAQEIEAPATRQAPATAQVGIEHPPWARNAAIYELNTRQFTEQGTFEAARAHLPRIRELGVDILWLMPVHPIGEARRKGTLGSPYAVRDYQAVNPEFGTLEDFKRLVDEAHALGMYVIIDWVANHSAWDNAMIESNPEWYTRDASGEITHVPDTDWTDVADLDYSQPGLRRYMTESLEYWVREADIDGYRCDVAGMVPLEFWRSARQQLEQIKPVFMLAEWEDVDLHHDAFDATYAWSWYDLMHKLAQGKATLDELANYYADDTENWPADSLRMTFVSNHDKNTWDGTQFQQFGPALEAAIVLSVVGDGIPLLYSGQEAGNEKRLEFFEKDTIAWRPHPVGDLYRKLFGLLDTNEALWHGDQGGAMVVLHNDQPQSVFSFMRRKGKDQVLSITNFSDQFVVVRLEGQQHHGDYRDALGAERVSVVEDTTLELEPWGYRVFVR